MKCLARKKCCSYACHISKLESWYKKYGGYERYSAELKYLMSQVKCIDSDEDDKSKHQYLIQGYKGMVGYKENISEFAICDSGESKEVERQLNRKFREEWRKVWAIMRKYIP